MKVLHVISGDLWAGAEAQAATLLAQLSEQPDLSVTAVILNHGELARRLTALPIRVVVLDEQRLNPLAIFIQLLALLREMQPDIVHTHRIKENILASIAAALVSKARGVRTVHGAAEHSAKSWPRRLLDSLDRWCGAHLQSATIAVSQELGLVLRTQCPGQNVVVIENGVQAVAESLSVNPPAWRSDMPQRVHVGIAGRLVPVKRLDLFIEMAALLGAQNPAGWQFHVFGDGPLRQQCEQQAQTLQLNCLTFHGQVDELSRQLRALDILIICSDHEGLPMVALEALAVQTPVLAHAVGGLRELLPASLLLQDNSASSYARQLAAMVNARADATAALANVSLPEKYTAACNARQVLALYRQIIAEAP